MRFLEVAADGGKDSGVKAYFLIELKWLFSIAILRFSKGSREAYHSHAFKAITWWLKGNVVEQHLGHEYGVMWWPSFKPKFTPRSRFHRIFANKVTWALTFRGPWDKTWKEYRDIGGITTLTNGRKIVDQEKP